MNLNRIQKNVLSIIQENPSAANDDSVLIASYWRKYSDWRDDRTLEENIARATRPETITRRRRELHNLELIQYSDEADTRREEAFVNEKQYAAVPWLAEDCGV